MLLITPTDWGSCADIRGIAAVCHDHGIPLIVDEAWGAHLPFHADLPPWGMDADADLVVTSVHKMGAAVEQSSVFHLQGDRVSPEVLKQREDLLGTTAPPHGPAGTHPAGRGAAPSRTHPQGRRRDAGAAPDG